MLLVYILYTTDFNDNDWVDLVEKTPPPVKHLAMTTLKKASRKALNKASD